MSSKWQRTSITKDLLKDFFHMYNTNPRKLQFSEGSVEMVALGDIIPDTDDWHTTIWRYVGLLKRIDRNVPYQESAWFKHEQRNQVKDIQKRFDMFKELYKSIKKNGYLTMPRKYLKLLDISKMKRQNPIKGGRISKKYYRTNGMKRILICNYLGINKIPCKIYRASIG